MRVAGNSRSIRSGTKWSDSQSVLKIEQYLLTDWMWVWEKEASEMAGGWGLYSGRMELVSIGKDSR